MSTLTSKQAVSTRPQLSVETRGDDFAFWMLVGSYAFSRVLQVYPGPVPMLAVVALHVIPPAIFALIHGAKFYGWRGIGVFVAIALVVGNAFENIGVRTGFPYGRYYFTDLMGPKILVVPVLLGLAYVGMAYLSWTVARIILGYPPESLRGWRVVTLPLIAAFVMVSWDFALDPVWGTLLRAWIWRDGGPYFGVPVSNFLGWFLLIYIIYQSFAIYLGRSPIASKRLPIRYWRQAVIFYAVSAAGNLLLVLPQNRFSVVTDPTGRQWRVADITATCALITVFTMGVFTLLASKRLADETRAEP